MSTQTTSQLPQLPGVVFWSPLVGSSLAQGCGRTAGKLGGAMGCRGLPSLTWSRPRPLLVNWSVPSATLTPDASEK